MNETLPPPAPTGNRKSKTGMWLAVALIGLLGLGVLLMAGSFLVFRASSSSTGEAPVLPVFESGVELGTLGAECVNTAPSGVSGSLCFIDGNDGLTIDAMGFLPDSTLSVVSENDGSIEWVVDAQGTVRVTVSGAVVDPPFTAHGILNNGTAATVTVTAVE